MMNASYVSAYFFTANFFNVIYSLSAVAIYELSRAETYAEGEKVTKCKGRIHVRMLKIDLHSRTLATWLTSTWCQFMNTFLHIQ